MTYNPTKDLYFFDINTKNTELNYVKETEKFAVPETTYEANNLLTMWISVLSRFATENMLWTTLD